MRITTKNLYKNIALFFMYIVLSIVTFIVTNNFLHIFLVWNLLLAAIPYGIVYLIDNKIIASKAGVAIALLLWLFFFPNSIYIITDLIYTDVDSFVINGGGYTPSVYVQDISSYLALFHIYLGSIIGLIYGFKSLSVLYNLSRNTVAYRYRDILVVSVFFLSGFGIYIGRFFRYNSWEFFKVFQILGDFISTFSWFTVFFILSLTLLQTIIFYSFKSNFTSKK
jgi:uncharacterized membrane protein